MSGLLAIQDFSSSLAGDESLAKRPMKRIIEPLLEMGAKISGSLENTLPLNIDKADAVKGIDYKMPVASAQVKILMILFAALGAEGDTKIIEKSVSRDHTEKNGFESLIFLIQQKRRPYRIQKGFCLKRLKYLETSHL